MDKVAVEEKPEPQVVEEQQAQDDFDAGADEVAKKPADEGPPRDEVGRFVAPTEKPVAEKPTVEKPEYVQITKEQLAKFEAMIGKTDEFEKQFSKVFGTVGDMQKIMRGLQSQTPRGVAVKIPPGAFDEMKKDFPELADKMQAVLETTLKGIEGTGAPGVQVDSEEFEKKLEERVLKIAADDLADEFPDWQKIVGAVDVRKGEKPDPENQFRKWLATKPQDYQDRINNSTSAGVITRAIRIFKSETKTPAPPLKKDPQAVQRANRIAEAVTPKGDGGQPPMKGADDDFEAGFRSG